jgi:lipoyl(octanoyl) transferase
VNAPAEPSPPFVEWAVSAGLTPYPAAQDWMERRAASIAADEAAPIVWLLQHPPLYTAGISAKAEDLLQPDRFPVFQTRRGGQFTYHGPGQRVAYVMLDLRARGRDVSRYVADLEAWLIAALARLDVAAGVRKGRVGVWVEHDGREEKIAAIGVRVRRWATFHGVALNVAPDLSHFAGIVPCGIAAHGVTSLSNLGRDVSLADADAALRAAFAEVFEARLIDVSAPALPAA